MNLCSSADCQTEEPHNEESMRSKTDTKDPSHEQGGRETRVETTEERRCLEEAPVTKDMLAAAVEALPNTALWSDKDGKSVYPGDVDNKRVVSSMDRYLREDQKGGGPVDVKSPQLLKSNY